MSEEALAPDVPGFGGAAADAAVGGGGAKHAGMGRGARTAALSLAAALAVGALGAVTGLWGGRFVRVDEVGEDVVMLGLGGGDEKEDMAVVRIGGEDDGSGSGEVVPLVPATPVRRQYVIATAVLPTGYGAGEINSAHGEDDFNTDEDDV